jgi:NADH dehydrogenase (ubiquinone) 1 alpha subcomplex subunit 9
MLGRTAAARFAQRGSRSSARAFATASKDDKPDLFIPRITERRLNEGGPGGRQSNADLRVAIFGATGFVGKHLCHQLGHNGAYAYIGNRGDEAEHRDIKPMFDLGHTRFVFYSPNDVDSMREVIGDADIVINLISKTHATGQPVQTDKFPFVGWKTNHSLEDTNVRIAKQIAELCVEMQVDNLIHVSALGISEDHPSEWARTKWAGEQAVRETYPWATIVRPTQLFGSEDKLLHYFANMSKMYGFIPVCGDGAALTQPVWAPDVAKVISRITDAPSKFEGRTVDCFGPSDYTYEELGKFVLDLIEQDKKIMHVPEKYYIMMAKALGYQSFVSFNEDMAKLWSRDIVPPMTAEEYRNQPEEGKILTMEDLGITATPIEKEAFGYLHRFRLAGHFGRVDGYH